VAIFRAWHPEILQQIQDRLGLDDLRMLFLVPQHTHGDRRFRALLPFAAQKLQEYRMGQAPLYLIYSIGKTGTQTIEQTLQHARLPGHVRRTHILSRSAIRRYADPVSSEPASVTSNQAQAAQARNINRLLLRQYSLRRRMPGLPPIRVICGVREPVAQLLARVFQDPLRYLGVRDGFTTRHVSAWLEQTILAPPDAAPARSPSARSTRAHALYFTDWFDDELRTVFGVDVYDSSFAWSRGWKIFETPTARVLVYRQEDLNAIAGVLAEFVGLGRLDLVNTNLRSQTPLAGLYERCRRECRLSTAVLDSVYGSRYARHFYSPAEIHAFRAQWQASPIEAAREGTDPGPVTMNVR
jgi:hypothetical protein